MKRSIEKGQLGWGKSFWQRMAVLRNYKKARKIRKIRNGLRGTKYYELNLILFFYLLLLILLILLLPLLIFGNTLFLFFVNFFLKLYERLGRHKKYSYSINIGVIKLNLS